jgi:uncharacterized protein with GYD domain
MEVTMPRYVLLSKASESGSGNIITWGAKGAEAYADFIKAAHGMVVAQYVVTGHYDLVSVIDFEDDIGCLAFSLRSEAGGLYVEALRAYSAAEVDEARSRMPDIVEIREQLLATKKLNPQG